MITTRIDLIGIFPENLAQMVAFYRDVLGFAVEWDGHDPYAEFQNDGVRFAMYERKQVPGLFGQTPTYPSGMNGTFEIAIDFPTYEDVDREFARIIAAGSRSVYPPRNDRGYALIHDHGPEGNLVEIESWNKGA